MPDAPTLLADRDADGLLVLTLNRPEKRNALDAATVVALADALGAADADPDVRAVVLTGAGDAAFCAGGDVADFRRAQEDRLFGYEADAAFARVLSAIPRLGVPVVAAVNGVALGGGLGLVAACDLAVAAPAAKFGTPEVQVGAFPMMISAPLQRLLPPKVLFELYFGAEPVDAAQALAWGLVNRIAREDVRAEARELARKVASRSPAAVRLGKQALATARDLGYEQALSHLQAMRSVLATTRDAAEGATAFLEKRAPRWTGR